ncbi:MAG: S8 family serine peptidase [Rubrivivax sp.]|nr:S8 family serine peptidase [Rubrivivax sp.]
MTGPRVSTAWPRLARLMRRWGAGVLAVAVLGLAGCGSIPPPLPAAAGAQAEGDDLIVVAVAEHHVVHAGVGASARADYKRSTYAGSEEARAEARHVAAAHGLVEVAAWTILPLELRCMLYRLPPGADRGAVLAALQRDPRVRIAQASNRFDTLAVPSAGAALPYNDPYLGLQHGLLDTGALLAQRVTMGEPVTVAVIDGAVDRRHPDLAERVRTQADYVGASQPESAGIDPHGTAVAGIIAATANNGQGIVGVAPRTKLLALRACWPSASPGAARCNTFTLAQALVAAISAGADVINLSLGGPRDPLLEQLVQYATTRGAVTVAALPASGRIEGFPAAVQSVLVAAMAEDLAARTSSVPGLLAAPGRDVLSLQPGGGYGYSSGSSMAAAHVSGAVALLKSLDRRLKPADAARLLTPATGAPRLDICGAVRALRQDAGGDC